ncbi:MAG: carbohydrate ABC transporter permease [Spirochaetales bacterium]|nr:carbohydrate ABC transporter permease [Spirochaetales bacterium]
MTGSVMSRKGVLFWILLALVLIVVLFPLYWVLITALKTPLENISSVPTFFPKDLTFVNFTNVLSSGFLRNLMNSLFVAFTSTMISLILAFLASYALVRYNFPYKLNVIFLIWVLVVKILPPMVLSIPLYTLFTSAKLINNHWGLIMVYQVYTLPYCIWMLFGFLKSLPLEFEQAAEIDGASKMKTLTTIVVPLSSSGIIATAIFSIIIAWDEFLFALLFIRTPRLQTLPLKIVSFITEYETLWGELMAIGLLATLPVLLFSGYYYKRLTEGFSLGMK